MNIAGTLPPNGHFEAKSEGRVFSRMRRAQSMCQHENVFLRTGLK